MAYSSGRFTVASTAVLIVDANAAAEVVYVKAQNNPVYLGASDVTVATGFRLDPEDGPLAIPDENGTSDLYAIAREGFSAQVSVLRKPQAVA